jgi:hypothetical protein
MSTPTRIAAAAALALCGLAAQAAPIVMFTGSLAGGDVNITGVHDITVGGSSYNVDFRFGTCAEVYGACNVASFLPAGLNNQPAGAALVSAWNDATLVDNLAGSWKLAGQQSTFVSYFRVFNATKTGCLFQSQTFDVCGDYFDLFGGTSISPQASFTLNALDGGSGGFFFSQSNTGIYTVWTANTPPTVPSGVPEPGSLALLAAAALALGVTRRRR